MMSNFSEIIRKICEFKGVSKPGQIIKLLGMNKRTFYTWRTRGEIPLKEIPDIARKTGIPLDRLLEGMGLAENQAGQINQQGANEMRIQSQLVTAEKILRSGSPFALALSQNIDAFWVGYSLWMNQPEYSPTPQGQETKT